jgi:hypothetical protein
MTRFSAAAAICISLSVFLPSAGVAQSDQTAASRSLTTTQDGACEGGSMRDGQCVCPAGFNLRQAGDNPGSSICVKTHAENCLGGELTVDGKCLCNGQVVMSGETYLLEYVRGKCVPKRCPVQTRLKDGKCVATSETSPKEEASEDAERRQHCGHGMVRTRAGCATVHRRNYYYRYH